jgi:3-hydroxyacyl-CoA dehydrogenase
VPEICDDIEDVDRAMRFGFNWKHGPFELIDKLGCEFIIENIKKNNLPIPLLLKKNQKFYSDHKTKSDYLRIEDVKRGDAIFSNNAVVLWDLGDLIACLELKTKMNILNLELFKGIEASLEIVNDKFKGLVIIGGDNFSSGADLKYIKSLIEKNDFAAIEQFINKGQEIMKLIKYAKIPIIAALSGYALGGGCEIALHAYKIRAYAESYIGLVEPTVGLIPAFGGCKESLYNYRKSDKIDLFANIMKGEISKSAIMARDMFLLGDKISITMNKDRLLADAKKLTLDSIDDFKAVVKINFDPTDANIDLSSYFGHDLMIAKYLKKIFNNPVVEDELLNMEKQAFIELCKIPETMIKIANKL